MSVTLLFIHHREVRRLKLIEAESVEEGEKLYQAFVESAAANDDAAWDEVEDDDPGESELREVSGDLPQDSGGGPRKTTEPCRVCTYHPQDFGEGTTEHSRARKTSRRRAGDLICRTCGERIPDDDLRTHLADHHPGAWAFDMDQVRDCYGEWP
jgi:hypothetical protein